MPSFKESEVTPAGTVVEILDTNGFVRLSVDEYGRLSTRDAFGRAPFAGTDQRVGPVDRRVSAGAAPDGVEQRVGATDRRIPSAAAAAAAATDIPDVAAVSDAAPAPDPAHDQAVADATAAVDAAPSAPVDHTQSALDDVNKALATWPDSPELQDAKTQLEAQLASNK